MITQTITITYSPEDALEIATRYFGSDANEQNASDLVLQVIKDQIAETLSLPAVLASDAQKRQEADDERETILNTVKDGIQATQGRG